MKTSRSTDRWIDRKRKEKERKEKKRKEKKRKGKKRKEKERKEKKRSKKTVPGTSHLNFYCLVQVPGHHSPCYPMGGNFLPRHGNPLQVKEEREERRNQNTVSPCSSGRVARTSTSHKVPISQSISQPV